MKVENRRQGALSSMLARVGTRPMLAAVSLSLLLPSVAVAQTVTRGPYLQQGTPSSIVVRWRTDVQTDSEVTYGTQQGNLTLTQSDATPTTEHEVQLTGLGADTVYYYAVGTTSQVLAGDDADHFFLTSPPAGSSKPTRIWVLGDSGTANADARAVRDAYLAFTGNVHTDLWLMLGDNAYNDGTDAEYQAAVFDTYPTMLKKSVLWSTLGNHDGVEADSSTETGPYYDIFTFPTLGEAGGIASTREAYYSFDYANVHFICLDSHETDRSVGGAMMTWLSQDVNDTTQDWIVAFWHHPPYTKGSHDSDSESRLIDMRQNALPILEAGGVDLVLSGHSHSYERSFLLDGHYGTSGTLAPAMILDGGDGNIGGNGAYEKPTAGPAPNEGAVYCVSGSSGKASGGPLNHPAMFVSLQLLGSLVLDVDGNQLDVRWIDSGGVIQDHFTMIKGATAAPAAPSNLQATTLSDSQIDLTWADGSSNESGFRIERSEDQSVWVEAGTVAANVTAFSDVNLGAATTYYYRAVAFNPVGDSPVSNTASATTEEMGTATRLANGELAVSGIVAGTFTDTHASDDVYEEVTERKSGGKPSNRHSFLEHKWTFDVASGAMVTLYVEAHGANPAEDEYFRFEYSTDDVNYTTALTVTKEADDDQAEMAVLSGVPGGTVFVRVVDTDSSQGNSILDTVFVDRLFIRTMTGTGDATPPAAPTNLAAIAMSSTQVDLDWDPNGEGDLAFYNVYRGTSPGGPYDPPVTTLTNTFTDTSVASMTTYFYVVTAVDTSGNESLESNEDSATTPDCTAASLHVAWITTSVENLGKGNKQGRTDVTIVDDCGNVVSGATVTGTFTGDFSDTDIQDTDGSGVAVLLSSVKKGSTTFTLCVDGVAHALTYSPADNVETCDGN